MTINHTINFIVGRSSRSGKIGDNILSSGIDDVGFLAATNRQRRLRQNLRRDFEPIVERELAKMGRDISRMAIGTNGGLTAPKGTLSIDGEISEALKGKAQPLTISSMTGHWKVRSKTYMKWKMRTYRTRKWFRNTGRLETQLRSLGTYRAAYGPIRISFIPKSIRNTSGNVSTLGRSRGGQSRNIQIGRLEVEPLRRLRGSDLPELGSLATYNENLLRPLADSIEVKLTGRPKSGGYRPVIEPFLTYYLTRKIPNAVFLRIEKSLT